MMFRMNEILETVYLSLAFYGHFSFKLSNKTILKEGINKSVSCSWTTCNKV